MYIAPHCNDHLICLVSEKSLINAIVKKKPPRHIVMTVH